MPRISDDEGDGGEGPLQEEKRVMEDDVDEGRQPTAKQLSGKDVAKACSFAEITEFAEEVVQKCIVMLLDGRTYKASLVPRWVDELNQGCVDELSGACDNIKYIVSSVIFERAQNAGLQYETTMFWDATNDGTINVSWENDTMGCIVTVFGVAM